MYIEFDLLGSSTKTEKKKTKKRTSQTTNKRKRKPKTLEQTLLKIQKKNPNRLVTLRHADFIHYVDEKSTIIEDTALFHNKVVDQAIDYVRQFDMSLAVVYNVEDYWTKHDVITIVSEKTEIKKDF